MERRKRTEMSKGKRKTTSNNSRLPILELIANMSDTARDNLRAILDFQGKSDWRGWQLVPPGSFLERVCTVFEQETDISLDIIVTICFQAISLLCLRTGITIRFVGENIRPDIWVIVLAPSGSSKTYAAHTIFQAIQFPADHFFPESNSTAKFVDTLSLNNNTLWLRDEIAQFLKAMETQSHMQELKDVLLQLYDGHKIVRRTKKESIEIDDPALSILGFNVPDSFFKSISMESMIDGFCQRFSYVIADADPTRPIFENPIYNSAVIKSITESAWATIRTLDLQPIYSISEVAVEEYKSAFYRLWNSQSEIPGSFYRRCLWRAIKYSLIYHILLLKSDAVIDGTDMLWASRLVEMNLADTRRLILAHGTSDLEKVIRQIEALSVKFGRVPTDREVVQYCHAIKSVHEAKAAKSIISFKGV
jgi:Protein of unknown function (DUF3987)